MFSFLLYYIQGFRNPNYKHYENSGGQSYDEVE